MNIFRIVIALGVIILFTLPTNSSAGNVVQASIRVINPIVVPPGKESEALAIWDKYAEFFKTQPGFIGTKLHRSIDPKAKFRLINVAEWRNAEDFSTALNSEAIKDVGTGFPDDMPYYPSLYQIIRQE